jgi:hypothetical protein
MDSNFTKKQFFFLFGLAITMSAQQLKKKGATYNIPSAVFEIEF